MSLIFARGLAFAGVLILVTFVPAATAQKPARELVECSIASLDPASSRGEAFIAWIKVENRGREPIEPLTFELVTKASVVHTLRRAPEPSIRRLGRPVASMASQTYPIFVVGSKDEFAGARIRLLEFSGTTGLKALEAPCDIGTPTTDKRTHELGGTVEFALLPLKNKTDSPIDITLRIRFDAPRAETVLFPRRLGPREAVTLTFNDLVYETTPEMVFEDQAFTAQLSLPRGAKIGEARLVDWCAILPPEKHPEGDPAPEIFRQAYASWLCWEKPLGLRARFSGSATAAAGPNIGLKGEFTRDSDGQIVIRADLDASDTEAVKRALHLAFADLSRPSTEQALKLCDSTVERRSPLTILRCRGPAWSEEYRGTRFAVDRGRFVGHNWFGAAEGSMRTVWQTEPMDGGYVVTERQSFHQTGRNLPISIVQWKYQRLGGVLVPTRVSVRDDPGGGVPPKNLSLDISEYVREDGKVGPVPSVSAEAVRMAWNRGRRVSKDTVDLNCRFVARPGKDAVWRGAKEVRGRLMLREFDGINFRDARAEVEGVTDSNLRDSLARIVIDRLPMWTGRDFAGRGDFDQVFAGTDFRATPSKPDHFEIQDGPYRSIEIKDGLIAAVVLQDGIERRYTWTEVAGTPAVTRVVTGPETVSAELTPFGSILVPKRMHFRGVFGDEKEWGTEELLFSAFTPP